jgi:phospholipid transport system substrate-binding protein
LRSSQRSALQPLSWSREYWRGHLPAAAAEDPTDFIRTLGSQGLGVLISNESPAQKGAYFYQMLRQDFDLAAMSRFILGPYWRIASKAQRQEFRSLLPEYIVRFDGDRFASSGGQGFRVTGSRTEAGGVLVTSQIIRPQGPTDRGRLAARDKRRPL